MLDPNTLSQLRQLKQSIEAQKDRAEGTIKGSQGRYGFVVLDDGREIFLPPEQMLRVFPDDRVAVEVIANGEGKPVAQLEKLLESTLREFTGQYVIREGAHFVEPDLPRLSRWLFVPPKLRRNARHGDYVRARIARHPFEDGRPQARVDAIIGNAESPRLEVDYALARYGCPSEDLRFEEADVTPPVLENRLDCNALPFLTIDGEDTLDMDDALHAEREGDGWRLRVAIADPTAWVRPGSALERAIARRGQSVYLPGHCVPMMPASLANERCSLLPEQERAALLCTLTVTAEGNIAGYEFAEARIRSRARLSYDGAAAALAAREHPLQGELLQLDAVAAALRSQRQRDHLLMPDRDDYRYEVDTRGHISSIHREPRNPAHRIVEECMVAANRCAADFLRGDDALFIVHNGFRPERGDNVRRLLESHAPALASIDFSTPQGYLQLLQSLPQAAATPAGTGPALPLRSVLSRSLERSRLQRRAAAHVGMGLAAYTTITSPIRKYGDFLLHRIIKARLNNTKAPRLDDQQLAQLQASADNARQAGRLAEQWLHCLWLKQQPKAEHEGEIVHINSSGFTVRLLSSGVEGVVDTRQLPDKYSFDQIALRLSGAGRVYQLEQVVNVSVASIDVKKRSIQFVPVETATADEGAEPATAS
jgi:VacB/RNase II family 3'-5' exoribonuclease